MIFFTILILNNEKLTFLGEDSFEAVQYFFLIIVRILIFEIISFDSSEQFCQHSLQHQSWGTCSENWR